MIREQYYCFPGPDGWAWCEMYFDGEHITAPTPYRHVADAVAGLYEMHPDAIIDELCVEDIPDALRFTLS